MVDNIAFGAPACVPATEFETVGAKLTVNDFRQLFENGIYYLKGASSKATILVVLLYANWMGKASIGVSMVITGSNIYEKLICNACLNRTYASPDYFNFI